MSGIYFGEDVRLKTYSALSKAGKSVIRFELETSDHFDLAHILRQLAEIDQAQRESLKPAKKAAAGQKKKTLGLPTPLLQIEDHREEKT